MMDTHSQPDLPRHRRRWYQFSVRTLLVFVVLASMGLSWLAVTIQKARRQQEAAKTILMYGSIIDFEDRSNCYAEASLLDHCAKRVVSVYIHEEELRIDAPKGLSLKDCVGQLRHLPHLRSLTIANDTLHDSVLQHLGPLDQLREFAIYKADVTNAGLEHLKGLSQLQTLILLETKVTPEGVKKLQQALPNCTIRTERR